MNYFRLRGRKPRFDDPVKTHGSTAQKKKSSEKAKLLVAKDVERWKLLFSKNKYQKHP